MIEIKINNSNINDIFRLKCCVSVHKMSRPGVGTTYLMNCKRNLDVAVQGDTIRVESPDSPECDIIMGEYHKSLITKL